MPKDAWAQEKKDLKSKDAKTFLYTANHLLLQRRPELTKLVEAVEQRLFTITLDAKAKLDQRLDAIKALVTLDADPNKLAPLLATEKGPKLLEAVARAIGGPTGTVASDAATTALIARFQKPGDWSPQYDAIVALRYFSGDDRPHHTFLAALKHPQGAVQREAINGLGHQRDLHAVPQLIPFLKSTNPQHVAAAARALWNIHLPDATAPLGDKKLYAHALKLAKDPINGRFGVRALQWFMVPAVDDDLLKLAKSQDGEVADGACEGLLHRRAVEQLAPLATHAFGTSDPSYYARFFVVLLNALAGVVEKPPAKVIADLAGVLSKVKPAVYEELLQNSEQLRYRIDRMPTDEQKRVAAWRNAMGKKIKDPEIRALAVQLMTSP